MGNPKKSHGVPIHLKFVCRFGSPNVGDDNCSPIQFLDFSPFETSKIDFGSYRRDAKSGKIDKNPDDVFVIGGGFFDIKNFKLFSHARKIVFWGGGIRNIIDHKWPFTNKRRPLPNLKKTLYGVRDYGFADEWVPCVSCMSPLFDNPSDVTNEYVIFEHHRQTIDLPFPKKRNTEVTFAEAIGFLSSAESVITNSYHGAYWSLLLGKKVFLVNEINSKTRTFKWPPVQCAGDEWKNTGNAVTYPGALQEARDVNLAFMAKAMDFLAV